MAKQIAESERKVTQLQDRIEQLEATEKQMAEEVETMRAAMGADTKTTRGILLQKLAALKDEQIKNLSDAAEASLQKTITFQECEAQKLEASMARHQAAELETKKIQIELNYSLEGSGAKVVRRLTTEILTLTLTLTLTLR